MRSIIVSFCVAAALLPAQAFAWGSEGHQIIAAIARSYLTPGATAKVDALLAQDPDTLTQPDMISRSTWADAWRGAGHKETAQWHFVDNEINHDDLTAACFGYPKTNGIASAGPANDCVVDKIEEFTAELSDSAMPTSERILALKYLLHFVGDVHQPLHASDNNDRGGNCVHVSLGGVRTTNLHSYWDTAVVQALGTDPMAVASTLEAEITPAQIAIWKRGGPRDWAEESYAVAKASVYTLGSPPGCGPDQAPIAIDASYSMRAQTAAQLQIEKAGVRLAFILNNALGS